MMNTICFLRIILQHVCSEAASFDIPAAVIAGAIEEAGTASELALAKIESVNPRVADEFGHNGTFLYTVII